MPAATVASMTRQLSSCATPPRNGSVMGVATLPAGEWVWPRDTGYGGCGSR